MEDNSLFNANQFGSRPGRCYLDPIIIEEYQNEINRITRKSFIKTNLDAKACYDRMIPSLTTIVSQKYRMDENVCIIQAGTLQQARYHMKTKWGMTEASYSHSEFIPVYGKDQGSGSSPVLWIIISSWLFDTHEINSTGVTLSTPDKAINIK